MKKNLYSNINTFMIRTPVLSFDNYSHHFEDNFDNTIIEGNILNLCENTLFRECILISSKNLYDTLNNFYNGKNIKKKDYFFQSIYKYLIRMSTRPTPFGLFSSINFGEYTNGETEIVLDESKYKKFVRPDLEWMMGIIKKLEKNSYEKLNFRLNDSIFTKGNRAFLLHSTQKEENANVGEVSIRVTNPLKDIFNFASKSISYRDLKKYMMEKYGEDKDDKIEGFIFGLIENEYLISNLRPPLTIKDQYLYLIKEVEKLDNEIELLNRLIEVKELIDNYMKTDLGNGEEKYIELYNKMISIEKTKNVLQVDMKSSMSKNKLNLNIINDINDLMNIFLLISKSFIKSDSYFSIYKQEYIEKYGQDREIHLLEMLDNDIGIGAPMNYDRPKNTKMHTTNVSNSINDVVKKYFNDKYLRAIKNKTSIKIIDKEINSLELEKYSYYDIPDSLEMNIIVKAKSKENISKNNFKYYLGPNLGSSHAGKSFGRFSYMMNGEEKLFEILNEKNISLKNSDDYVSCELVYLPNDVRNANVTRNIHSSEYEIALFTNNSKEDSKRLDLSDILIGIDDNRFYVKSKSLGKKLLITINNMLNIQAAPNAIRFLYETSTDEINMWYNFPWSNMFTNYSYIPKIEYKNFIISPEKWILDNKILNINKKTEFENFKEKFNEYCLEYNVPNKVYITFADNRILINLNDDKCLRILKHELNNSLSNVILSGYEDYGCNLVTDSNKYEYISELVIPLIKNNLEINNKAENTKKMNNISSSDKQRLKVPFDEWLYLKLYGTSSNADDLIAFYISEYCNEKISNKDINRYFFMRYADPDQHIRLRFNAKQEKLLELYPDIKSWLCSLIEGGIISRYSIESYDREIERYGGIELMNLVETLFCFDSIIVESILRQIRNGELGFNKETVGMISLIHYMEDFGLDHDTQVDFLRAQVNHLDYRDEFKKNRNEFIKVCNTSDNWRGLKESEDGRRLIEILNQRSNIVQQYAQKIGEGLEVSTKLSILDSIIHLHCNRVFGIDREVEKKVRALTSHALYTLKYFKK